jgi:hypothetical protein
MIRSLAFIATLAVAGQSHAAVVLGNLDNTIPGTEVTFSSSTTISVTQAKAAVFTVDQTLRLDAVYLALGNFDDQDVPDFFIGALSGTSINSLRMLELIAPATSTDNTNRVWQFGATGTTPFDFQPGIDYALTLGVGDVATNITWGRVGPTSTPAGLASITGYYFASLGSGGAFIPSTDAANTNSFTITGMPVPAPAPLALMALGLGLIAMRRPHR